MRVARLHGREDLRLHDEDKPRPGPGEALVRVRAVGVCGSDIHWFAEGGIGEAHVRRPFVLGHEFGGVTEDGRRVAVDPAIPCEACPSCLAGHANLCQSVRFAGDGAYDGGLGEWIAWPQRCLVCGLGRSGTGSPGPGPGTNGRWTGCWGRWPGRRRTC